MAGVANIDPCWSWFIG